jgi:DNA repair protein RadC
MNVKLTAQQKSKPIYTASDHASAPPCWAGLAHGVYSIMQPILLRENKQRRKQEYFWVRASPSCLRQAGYGSASMGIDDERYLQFVELLAHAYGLAGLGGQNRVHIKPAEAFRIAIQKNADYVIFAHNPRLTERGRHPAGKLQPSPDDKDATDPQLVGG